MKRLAKDKFRLLFIFGFILVLAFLLRVVALERFPVGFTADEASQGYTAYSILKTSKDEWGVRLPLTPRSFGDFKPPLYTYLTIPSIAIFGLNQFAVRFPAAILGTLAVLVTFLMTRELFKNLRISYSVSLIASLFLAVSPWHIQLSRGAFEANLTTFFLPLGFWLFLKGLKNPRYLFLASLFFGLNLFTYHTAKLFTPLFLVALIFWQREKLKRLRKEAVLPGLIFAFFVILAFYSILAGGGTRAADVGIFSAGLKAPKLFVDNYLSYLSPEFFFTQGAGEASYGMIPTIGVLYLFELPLLILAFIALTKKGEKNFLPILVWLVLAPIAAALTQGVGYHANRVAVMMPAIQVLSAYGLVYLLSSKLKHKKVISAFFAIWIFASVSLFLWTYFRHGPKILSPAMSYGWKETAGYLNEVKQDYEKIIISRQFCEPQAFVAFYQAYPPKKFQEESADWLRYEKEGFFFVDQLGEYSLGKYQFRHLSFPVDKELENVLLVGKSKEFPSDIQAAKTVRHPNGQPAILIVEPINE